MHKKLLLSFLALSAVISHQAKAENTIQSKYDSLYNNMIKNINTDKSKLPKTTLRVIDSIKHYYPIRHKKELNYF